MSKLRLIQKGIKATIYAIERDGESCPAAEAKDADPQTSAQFAALFKLHGEAGTIYNQRRFRLLDLSKPPRVAEWKSNSGWRIYGIWDSKLDAWIQTHGRKKPKDKQVVTEGERAQRIYREWEAERDEGR